ncbi:MAG: YifB family Mg chelatase-like AAA ATPase [Actinomycetia bacterium]|nr:YifB family Mg chelatase-like AAA ATPase [Actinomycetes bacterium]
MYCELRTATLSGIDALPVDVQVHVASGLPAFHIVGMGDVAVKEARQRVTAALRSCGFKLPNSCITVNLAPALVQKHGTGFDLAMALGILIASGQASVDRASQLLVLGELGLQGQVSTVAGLVSCARLANEQGRILMTPHPEQLEGIIACQTIPIEHLSEIAQLQERPVKAVARDEAVSSGGLDFADVAGQSRVIRALCVAAAGQLSVFMVGPPGTGKTMLASRLPSIMAPLSREEFLEVALVASAMGRTLDDICAQRPFRNPHHSASPVGIIGGGSPIKPGEITLAHNGVLFLDEMPQFAPVTLQALRQPLEEGCVRIVRAQESVVLPARVMLVGAANPCPCGYYGDKEKRCHCAPAEIQSYQNRIGGPLMDRFDMVLYASRPPLEELFATRPKQRGLSSAELRAQVIAARDYAQDHHERPVKELEREELCSETMISPAALKLLQRSAERLLLSPRALVRVGRVARIIADMQQSELTEEEHLIEALSYRVSLFERS